MEDKSEHTVTKLLLSDTDQIDPDATIFETPLPILENAKCGIYHNQVR